MKNALSFAFAVSTAFALVACGGSTPPSHGTPRFQTPAFAEVTGDLVVHVDGIPDIRGELYVELYDATTYFRYDAVLDEEIVPVTGRAMTVTLKHVPNGRYIVCASHDANKNKVLDRSVFGFPVEAYGFSRGARGTFGPPDFETGAFDFVGPSMDVAVVVR